MEKVVKYFFMTFIVVAISYGFIEYNSFKGEQADRERLERLREDVSQTQLEIEYLESLKDGE